MKMENRYFEFEFSGSCRPGYPEDNTLIIPALGIEDAMKRYKYLRNGGNLTPKHMCDIRHIREIWYVLEVDEKYKP